MTCPGDMIDGDRQQHQALRMLKRVLLLFSHPRSKRIKKIIIHVYVKFDEFLSNPRGDGGREGFVLRGCYTISSRFYELTL